MGSLELTPEISIVRIKFQKYKYMLVFRNVQVPQVMTGTQLLSCHSL